MKYKSKAYSPEELRNKWDEAETHFPLSQFVFVVVWQFMIGFFPLMAVDYFIYRLFQYFSIDLWIQILLSPLLFILNYGGYIYFTTFFCKILVNYYNQKSPPREGIFLRSFEKSGMKNPELDYYHLRGVLYKWPVFFSKKSIFPWSVNYVLREVGDNKVHKDAWFGDVYVGLEYANAEENAIVLDGTSISSHVVDAIFGSLSIFEVNLRKGSTISSNIIIGPGAEVDEKTSIAPRMLLPKKWAVEDTAGKFLWGNPVPGKPENVRTSFMDYLPKTFREKNTINIEENKTEK